MQTTPFSLPPFDYAKRAQVVTRNIQDRAFRLAASVGIPRDMCCIHNASIDDSLSGWCKDSPETLRVAKRVVRMINESWKVSTIGEGAWRREYNRRNPGYSPYSVSALPAVNLTLCFGRI